MLTLTADDQMMIEKFANYLIAKRLETPAILFLELHRPLRGLLHTLALGAEPLIAPLFGTERVKAAQFMLAEPERIELLLHLLESHSSGKDH